MKNAPQSDYESTVNIYRINNLNISDCRSRSPLSFWLLRIPWELIEYDRTAQKLRKSGYVYVPISSKLLKQWPVGQVLLAKYVCSTLMYELKKYQKEIRLKIVGRES